jgi:hypothetical protein
VRAKQVCAALFFRGLTIEPGQEQPLPGHTPKPRQQATATSQTQLLRLPLHSYHIVQMSNADISDSQAFGVISLCKTPPVHILNYYSSILDHSS